MDEENWLTEPRPTTVVIAEGPWLAAELAWLLLPVLLLAVAWFSHRRVRNARRSFQALLPTNRELIVGALLFVVHNGAVERGQSARGYVRKPAHVLADLLTLDVHLVDEALRGLIEQGYLEGTRGSTAWQLTTHLETTPKGHHFHQEHFGTNGGVLDLAPLGLVILGGGAPAFPSPRRAPDELAVHRAEDSGRPPTP